MIAPKRLLMILDMLGGEERACRGDLFALGLHLYISRSARRLGRKLNELPRKP